MPKSRENPQYEALDGSTWILVRQRDGRWDAAIVSAGTSGEHEDVMFSGSSAADLTRQIDQYIAAATTPPSRGNPGSSEDVPQLRSAKKLFEDFHDFEMRGSGRFKRDIIVPDRIAVIGPCKYVTYRSDKWNDGTHEYIHKITSFPRVQMGVVGAEASTRVVPARVRDAVTVSFLGKALGFAAEIPDGDELEGTFPSGTDWFWSPTGKALYAIRGKSRLLAVVWGGDLDVEPRGIVG